MGKDLPSISIVIPTYNEERNIERCLKSIYKQVYPKKLLEVLVVDNYSEDKTIEIAQKYPLTLLKNKVKDAQVSKMIGFKRAKGELFYYMDADLEFVSPDYLQKLAHPLLDNPLIVGSSGKIIQLPNDTSLNRFLTYDIHQRGPVLKHFSSSIYSTIIEKQPAYLLCKYTLGNVPPVGRCLLWRSKLLQTPIVKAEKFMELDNLIFMVKSGFCYFAFVPEAQEYHRHVQGVRSLIKKRLRNINRNFLPSFETRQYTWFNLRSKRDIIKIILWIIYAHLIIPAFLRGCIKAIRYKDLYCMWYEPFLTLLLTDVNIYGFISNPRGFQFILSNFLHYRKVV